MVDNQFEGIKKDELQDQPGSYAGGAAIPPENLPTLHKDQRPHYAGEAVIEPLVPGFENPDALSGLSPEEIGKIALDANANLPKPKVAISNIELGPDLNPEGPSDNYLD